VIRVDTQQDETEVIAEGGQSSWIELAEGAAELVELALTRPD
jgi:hypothetical protein